MDGDGDVVPSSPTNTSPSSSDLDTESTGSFFRDRSTSLGTLMGVTYPRVLPRSASRSSTAGTASVARHPSATSSSARGGAIADPRRRRPARTRRRGGGGGRRWWMLCREEEMARRTSLGDFLQVERRLSGAAAGGAEAAVGEHVAVGAGPLFADGRVIPPPHAAQQQQQQQQQHRRDHGAIGRLPVLLTGICIGG